MPMAATCTMEAQEMPTLALWMPKGVDTHPMLVEVIAFKNWPRMARIRGPEVKEQWVPLGEVQVMQRHEKVKVVPGRLKAGRFPKRRG